MTNTSSTGLMPGDYVITGHFSHIQTLLGSCVAMVFWHPRKKIGCMCHFVLPSRCIHGEPDARYADEFMQILLSEIQSRGTRPQDYQVKLYGAGNMFKRLKSTCADVGHANAVLCDGCQNVSCKNRIAALNETKKYGFNLVEADLGGAGYRHVEFDTADGTTLVRTTLMIDAA